MRRDGATWRAIGLILPVCTNGDFFGDGGSGAIFRTTLSNVRFFLVAMSHFPFLCLHCAKAPISSEAR
jgi:hypothetical protein